MKKGIKHLYYIAVTGLSLITFSLHHAYAGPGINRPDSVLNLKPWTLALPINSNGLEQEGTKCIFITNQALNAGFTSKYFYVSADTGVTFWCPIEGATTSPGIGSDHPRTELVETTNRPSTQYASLTAIAAVKQYPSKTNDIIIGQIHGAGAFGYAPFVMLHANAGNIIAYVKGDTTGNTGTAKYTLLQNVAIGAKITYTITSDSTNIYFTASCPGATGTGKWNTPIPSIWAGLPVRFSAGDYVQDTGISSTDGGMITFYQLLINLKNLLPLPPLSYLNAQSLQHGTVRLQWAFNEPTNNVTTVIERSDYTGVFHAIAMIRNNADGLNFTYTDTVCFSGQYAYRLKMTDNNGETEFSKIMPLMMEGNQQQFKVSTLIHNGITIFNSGKTCAAELYNAAGTIVSKFMINSGQNTYPIPNNLLRGIYYVRSGGNVFKVIN